MMSKISAISLVTLGSVCLTGTTCVGATARDVEAMRQEWHPERQRLRSLGQALELEAIEELAPSLEKKWFAQDLEYYGYVMRSICGVLSSHGFDDYKKAHRLSREYAMLALEKSHKLQEDNRLSVEHEVRLLLYVQEFNASSKHYRELAQREGWLDRRERAARLYFRTWGRLLKAIDKEWDPNDPSMRFPRPPAGVDSFVLGMSPEHIKDPELRAEYEAALQKYRRERKKVTEQRLLQRLKKDYLPSLQKDLLRLYSGPSFDCKELESESLRRDLQKYVEDEDIRATILDEMKKALQKELEPREEVVPQDVTESSRRRGSRPATGQSQGPD